MIITLDTIADVGGPQDFLNIEGNKRTIPFTIRMLASHYCSHVELEVQVNKELLHDSVSYLLNPAQLAKNVNVDGHFARVRGLIKKGYIVIFFTNDQVPVSFWQKAIAACETKTTTTFPIEEVPTTYRHNPTLLRWRLKQATGVKVRTVKNDTAYKIVVPTIRLDKRH